MADSSKTEKATPKKRRDERKKGNVFFSNDAVSVAVLLASFFVLKLTATPMVEQIYRFLQYAMGLVAGAAHTGLQDNLSGLVLEMLKTFLFAAGPLLATTAVVAVAATFFQTKLLVSGEALKPKFSRINPLQGIKRLFSLRSVIEALKGILKITVLLFLIYQFLVGIVDTFTKYLHTDLAVACAHLVDEGFQMVMQIAIAFVVLAGADVFYQWWDYERQIRMSNPIGLLHGTAEGEKPPKGNLLLAILGVVLLAGAYYIAVTIENPVSALMHFFAAVLMVILGTYLIFISGSVVLCRWLKKWKCYYYKPNHFISVSSMLYRMKRNGAGLASICILSTMVLVMISSSGCLYIGKENILRRQYPRDMQLAVWDGEEEHLDLLQSISEEYMQRHGFTMKDAWRYRYLSVAALADGDRLAFQRAGVSAGSLGDVSDLRNLLVIPLSDYNRATGKDETLPEGEILIGVNRGQEYPYETMKIGNLDTWKVKKTVPQPFDNKVASYEIYTTYFLIVPDMDSVYQVEKEEKKVYGDYASDVRGYFGFNVDCRSRSRKEFRWRSAKNGWIWISHIRRNALRMTAATFLVRSADCSHSVSSWAASLFWR